MRGANVLKNQYFIKFKRFESSDAAQAPDYHYAAQIVDEVADGWFYIREFSRTDKGEYDWRVVPVGELTDCRFYCSESDFYAARRALKPVELSRLPPLGRTGGNDGK